MRKILTLVLINSVNLILAQNKCIVVNPPYDSALFKLIDSRANKIISDFNFNDGDNQQVSFYLGPSSYAFVDCRSDWYKYVNGRWKNTYLLNNHGFTCNSVLFIEDGWPHVYGGYGIWRGQSLNIQMDKNGEWYANRANNCPENYKPAIGFKQKDSTVILLGGNEINTLRNVNNLITSGYSVSPSGEWNEINYVIPGQTYDIGFGIVELSTTKYRVSITHIDDGYRIYVYDNRKEELTFNNMQWNTRTPPLYYLSGDSLVINSGRLIHFNIPDLIDDGERIVISKSFNPLFFKSWFWVFFLLPITWVVFRKYRAAKNPINYPQFYNEMLQRSGNSYTGEQMNELFGIDHLSYDQVRKKRASILQSINDFHSRYKGKQLIIRIRDERDKRNFIYRVN